MDCKDKVTKLELAQAVPVFEAFFNATTMKHILGKFRELCLILKMQPTNFPYFYTMLKSYLSNHWKAQSLLKKIDARASHRVYKQGMACPDTKVLVIGAGPSGLRTAIECQLLGCKVVVLEKRTAISRNNILHLWPFVIHDLKALGAKRLYGKFCAGSIDHISIRNLQCILLKIALLIGVEICEGVSFLDVVEPTEIEGWRARLEPAEHPASQYQFDVLVGADGKRNTLKGFKHNPNRAKLAIAITANFKNTHTEQEAAVPEISGVSYIFNQKFFNDLAVNLGIELENIVYYKGDTHYFVMTPKKQSLIERGVILKDSTDTGELLQENNVDREALLEYARAAAVYATGGKLPHYEYAVNGYNKADAALFDFTTMYSSENASRVEDRLGRPLLCCLVGDSLHEPFWPMGTGCARGFLAAFDCAWAVRRWGQTPRPHPLLIIAERESLYRLLAQTKPDNIYQNFSKYTLDPATRYPKLNREAVTPHMVQRYYISDNPLPLDKAVASQVTHTPQSTKRKRREMMLSREVLMRWIKEVCGVDALREACSTSVLAALVRRYRPELLPAHAPDESVLQLLHREYNITPDKSGVPEEMMIQVYLSKVYKALHDGIQTSSKMERKASSEVLNSADERLDSQRKSRRRRIEKMQSQDSPSVAHQHRRSAKWARIRRALHRANTNYDSEPENVLPQWLEDPTNGNINHKTDEGSDLENMSLITKPIGKLVIDESKFTESLLPSTSQAPQRNEPVRVPGKITNRLKQLLDVSPIAAKPFDVGTDYDIQEYRANSSPFKERIKNLEKQIFSTEEGRLVGSAARSPTGGATVARLAAELASAGQQYTSPRTNKPPDLLRAVGKIEKSDWQVRQIERAMKKPLETPEPRAAEKVPKWDREQFLARQNRLQAESGAQDEKYGELDETLQKIDRKLKDSGRPDLGTNKVADLAGKFKSTPTEPEPVEATTGKTWVAGERKPAERCAVCGARVFAAEQVHADGIAFHRACFKCAVCKNALRPGHYTMERWGKRLLCQWHSSAATAGVDMPCGDVAGSGGVDAPTPERIGLEADGRAEMDEDEWTDKNFITSETSAAGGLSDEDSDSSSAYSDAAEWGGGAQLPGDGAGAGALALHRYPSDDSFGYDDFSDDGSESSGAESSRLREAREARRREVPPDNRPPSDSSENESEEESEESSMETSSGTAVSTDSEFAHEEPSLPAAPPAITVTEAAPYIPRPPPTPTSDYPLSRTKSAGGIATKRALELKRRYLLGESSPSAVRKSDSASRLDSKFESFRSNITEFQKLLNPAPVNDASITCKNVLDSQNADHKMPSEPRKLVITDISIGEPKLDASNRIEDSKLQMEATVDTDSLSDDSSIVASVPSQPVPRLEVHDDDGVLIQLDSLVIVDSINSKSDDPLELSVGDLHTSKESNSSDSAKDLTTIAATETELYDDIKDKDMEPYFLGEIESQTNLNSRFSEDATRLSGTKNLDPLPNHVCGKTNSTPTVLFSNALEDFEFADEGDHETEPKETKNQGFLQWSNVETNAQSPEKLTNYPETKFVEIINPNFIEPAPEEVNITKFNIDNKDSIKTTNINNNSINLSSNLLDKLFSPPLCSSNPTSPSSFQITSPLSYIVSSPLMNDQFTGAKLKPLPFAVNLSTSDQSKVSNTVKTCVPSTDSVSSDDAFHKVAKIKQEREKQADDVRKLVLEKMATSARKSTRRRAATPVQSPVAPAAPLPSPGLDCQSNSYSLSTSKSMPYVPERLNSNKTSSSNSIPHSLSLSPMMKSSHLAKSHSFVTKSKTPVPPPVPPPPMYSPKRPPKQPVSLAPSFSDPDLARVRRRRGIFRTVSEFFNRRLGARPKQSAASTSHMAAEALPPTPPPPPRHYLNSAASAEASANHGHTFEESSRKGLAARRGFAEAEDGREKARSRAEARALDREEAARAFYEASERRIAYLQRRLRSHLPPNQEAETVAELLQLSARWTGHAALLEADRIRHVPASLNATKP